LPFVERLGHKDGQINQAIPGVLSHERTFNALLRSWQLVMALGLLLGGAIWSYWSTMGELWRIWTTDDDYSVGLLVPFVAVYLVWRSRGCFQADTLRTCWYGLVVVAAAQAGRFFGFWFYFGSVERYSLVITIGGVGLLVIGWAAFRSLFWVLVFLLLAVPLPNRIHESVLLPLQQLATTLAAFILEGLGFVVQRSGAVLQVAGGRLIAVTEACNGLRMLTAFVFVAAVMAFMVRRPAWEKAAIVASSFPMAILVNAARLVATGWYTQLANPSDTEGLFHSLVGVAMMPVALLILMAELSLMARLTDRRAANASV